MGAPSWCYKFDHIFIFQRWRYNYPYMFKTTLSSKNVFSRSRAFANTVKHIHVFLIWDPVEWDSIALRCETKESRCQLTIFTFQALHSIRFGCESIESLCQLSDSYLNALHSIFSSSSIEIQSEIMEPCLIIYNKKLVCFAFQHLKIQIMLDFSTSHTLHRALT